MNTRVQYDASCVHVTEKQTCSLRQRRCIAVTV